MLNVVVTRTLDPRAVIITEQNREGYNQLPSGVRERDKHFLRGGRNSLSEVSGVQGRGGG